MERDAEDLAAVPRESLGPVLFRDREDAAKVPRDRHPDEWVPHFPFVAQIGAQAQLAAATLGVAIPPLTLEATGTVGFADIPTVDLGVIAMRAEVKQYTTVVESATGHAIGDQEIAGKIQLSPALVGVGIGERTLAGRADMQIAALSAGPASPVVLPAAAKIEPLLLTADPRPPDLSFAAKVESIGLGVGLGFRELAMVSKAEALAIKAGRRYQDNADRANNTSLGTDWINSLNGSNRIISNAFHAKAASNGNGRASAWNSWQGAAAFADAGRLYSDNWRIRAQLTAPSTAAATDNFTIIGITHDTWNQAGINKVYALVSTGSGSGIVVQTGTMNAAGIGSGQAGQTVPATAAVNFANTDVFEFERNGNVFTIYKNGVSTGISWNDSGATVPKSASFRKVCFAVECNFPMFNQQFSAPGISDLQFWDL